MEGAVEAREQADEELRESRRLLAQAEELGGFGSYAYTPLTGKVTWSDGLYRLYGTTRAAFGDPGVEPLRYVHPEDRAAARRMIAGVAESQEAAELRHRIVRDGVTGWAVSRVQPDADNPDRLLGTVHDVTSEHDARCRQEDQAAQLRQTQEFLQAALENLSDAVVACDAGGTLTLFNPAARRLHGLPERPVGPAEWASYYGLLNDDGTPMTPAQVPLRRALAGEPVRDVRMVVTHANGVRRVVEATGRQLRDADGLVLGAVVAMHDITDSSEAADALHRQAARLRAAIRAQHEITEVSTDRDVTLRRVAERAMELVPAADGAVVEILQGAEVFVYTAVTGTMGGYEGTRVKAAGSLSGLAAIEGRAQYCADTAHDPRVDAATCAQLRIASMLIAPLFDAGSVIGVVKVTSGLVGAFEENDRLQLELLAGAVGAALRHAEDFAARTVALAAARASEERFRSAFEHAPQGIAIVGIGTANRGAILSANPALCAMLGRTEAELRSTGMAALTHPDDLERDVGTVRELLSGEWPLYRATKRFVHADGRTVVTSLHAAPLHDADGRPTSMIVQVADVTEQRNADNRLRQQAELLDRTHDAIIVRDLANKIQYWNAGAAALYGWPTGEARGLVTHRLLHTRRVDGGSMAELDAVLLTEGRWDGELMQLRADGSTIIVASRHTLQRDQEGEPSAILEINNDVTARRAAEDALAKREERFRTQFEQVAIGQSLTALDGQLIEVNDAYCAMLGRRREDLVGTGYGGLMHPDHFDDRLQLAQLFGGRIATYRREVQMLHADGSPIDVDARISLIRGDDGRPQAFLTQLIDVTARRVAEQERDAAAAQLLQRNAQLEQSNRDLLAANQLKLDLMGMLSHEIGNPLTAIAGHAEVLLDLTPAGTPPTDRRLRSLQAIARSTARLAEMRHEILTMCALDTGNIIANREPVDVAAATALALAATELTVPVHGAEGVTALVSPSHLQHILINYLTNANKYAGGTTCVEVSQDDTGVEIRVSDEGPGVDPQFREHLFERFTRSSDAGARAQGTGLGLYIVHGLAEANDGAVWFTPNTPTGSIFCVRLKKP